MWKKRLSDFIAAGSREALNRSDLNFVAMGTEMRLTAYGTQAREALDESAACIRRLDALLATRKANSDIRRLNASKRGSWVPVDPKTSAILKEALSYAEKTGGTYDPAVGALVDLWRIGNGRGKIPADSEIQRALRSCDYHNLQTDGVGRFRLLNGAQLDLGGIAKGYACDRVAELCRNREIRSALFSLGTSSMLALGGKPDGSAWRIGLQDVDGDETSYFGVVPLRNQFLSTSGDYEQSFVRDGRRYHHILDKSTGTPADSGLRAVSVIADNGTLCEAYSTALFVMGLEKALTFQKRVGSFEAVFVTSDKQVVCTPGLKRRFEFTGRTLGYHYESI